MNTMRVTLEVLLWRHGWAWPLAVLAVAATAALQLAVVQPDRAAIERLNEASARLQATRPHGPTAGKAESPGAGVDTLAKAALPSDRVASRLLALAQAQGITLPRADYQQQAHVALPLMQLRLSQPVRTTYPRLRRYIESVLREMPAASLDRIAAHRGSVEDPELEIRLEWSFWLPLTTTQANGRPAPPEVVR